MYVYLMQHGAALSEAEDPARPLSAGGRAAVGTVTTRAYAMGLRADICVHSGKLRAEQTAALLAAGLGIPKVAEREGLKPKDPVPPFAAWLVKPHDGRPDRSVAVVGHLPFLDRLASLLVAGDEDAQVVNFHNAGLVRLVSKTKDPVDAASGGFSVDVALTP